MLRETLKHNKLYKDVKQQFENDSNLKSADEILKVDQFEINTFCNSGDIKKIYYDFYKCKETYQSIFNLFKEGQIDQSLKFSSNSTETKSIPEKNTFVINGEPDKNDASEALYNYLLHFLIIQLFEKLNGLENIHGTVKCAMCDMPLNRIDPECSACSEPNEYTIDGLFQQFVSKKSNINPENEREKENVKGNRTDKRKTNKKRELGKQEERLTDSKQDKQMMESKIDIEVQPKIGQGKGDSKVQTSIEDSIEIEHEKQFMEPDMNMEKEFQDDRERKNDQFDLKTGNDEIIEKRREENTMQELWECKRCTYLNDIPDQNCAICGNKNENTKVYGASNFSEVNPFKGNNRLPNVNLNPSEPKLCQNCREKEPINGVDCATCLTFKWDCTFRLCGKVNYGKNAFCRHCGVEKTSTKVPGCDTPPGSGL